MILFLAFLNYFPDVLKYLSVPDSEWIFIFFEYFSAEGTTVFNDFKLLTWAG